MFCTDPVEPNKLIEAAKHENVNITHALTTHHHADHAGGNDKIAAAIKGIHVLGGDDRIPAMTKKVLLLFSPLLYPYCHSED